MSHAVGDEQVVEPAAGRTEFGTISVADRVVAKIAARAAAENPDVGAPATRLLGIPVPAAGGIGGHDSDLDALPKSSVEVDGAKAFLTLQISVRWPASIRTVTETLRSHVADRVNELTGLSVDEVHITVQDMVTDITPPPRVR
jgi:uncharacterized alkaline shock family protein YloU